LPDTPETLDPHTHDLLVRSASIIAGLGRDLMVHIGRHYDVELACGAVAHLGEWSEGAATIRAIQRRLGALPDYPNPHFLDGLKPLPPTPPSEPTAAGGGHA